jgi:hypothetical protein
MRPAPLLGALALLAFAGPATPQSLPPGPGAHGPDIRYVSALEVEVRAGPSDKFYPTNLLRRGDKVEVIAEHAGWLAIRPPEGSFSWVNTRFLQNVVPRQPNYVVTPEGTPVPVLIGSTLYKDQPTVEGPRLQRGTQVRSVGPAKPVADGSSWMPIESPAAEKRYLPADVVSKTPMAPVTPVTAGPGAPAGTATPPINGDVLWRQAQQAEQAGQIAVAIQLYEQAGKASLSLNPERAMAAYDRARYLERTNPGVSGGSFAPGGYGNEARYNSPSRIYPLPAGPTPPAAGPGNVSGPRSESGYLTVSGRLSTGSYQYMLLDDQRRPRLYAMPAPGVDLGRYVNSNVRLTGTVAPVENLRSAMMTVSYVQPAP